MKKIRTAVRKALVATLGTESTLAIEDVYKSLETRIKYRTLSAVGRESARRLKKYHNKHAGERCFIIGNGPSLQNMDLSLLKNETTFGLNRIYLLFGEMGFPTTYYVSVNKYVIEQFAADILKLPCPKFLSWHARDLIPFSPDMMFIPSERKPGFCTDLCKESIWEGATVTYVTMQIAYYMGFQQVVLIGVDHSFATKGQPHKLLTSEGADPNHFHPEYFGKGVRWQLPDLETSEIAYRMARRQFEAVGRQIVDATVGGKLEVFPKADYRELLQGEPYTVQ